jgi:hypothetical protein
MGVKQIKIRCCGAYLDLQGRKEQEDGEKYIIRSFVIVFFVKYYWGEQIKRMRMTGCVERMGNI